MVVAAGGEESSFLAESLHHIKAKDPVIEVECPLQVGDLQVYMTNPSLRIYH